MTFLQSHPHTKLPENAADVRETQLQEVPEQVSRNILLQGGKYLTFDVRLRKRENYNLRVWWAEMRVWEGPKF